MEQVRARAPEKKLQKKITRRSHGHRTSTHAYGAGGKVPSSCSCSECIYTHTSFHIYAHLIPSTCTLAYVHATYFRVLYTCIHIHIYTGTCLPRGAAPACGAFGTHNSTNFLAHLLHCQRHGRLTTYIPYYIHTVSETLRACSASVLCERALRACSASVLCERARRACSASVLRMTTRYTYTMSERL
jgi:hypothetical protein